MTWRTEPTRGRILITCALAGAALIAAAGVWGESQPRDSWQWIAAEGLPLVLIIAAVAAILVTGVWHLVRRPQWRFGVQPGAFDVGLPSTGLMPVAPLLLWGVMLANAINAWLSGHMAERAVYTFTLLALSGLLAAAVVFAWRRNAFQLTPAGIEQHTALYHRTIAWDALAPGGPLPTRDKSMLSRIDLVTVNPALVTESGWALGAGTAHRPVVPAKTAVHPWLLAGAIRWYAEHPEHRAAIGTQPEHDRLITAIPPP